MTERSRRQGLAGGHRFSSPLDRQGAGASADGGGGESWRQDRAAQGEEAAYGDDEASEGSQCDPDGEAESYVLRLLPELRSVGQARSKLTEMAGLWGTPEDVLDDARVVLTELMSNGVLHARTELEVVMSQRGGGLRVEVHDASSVPVLAPLKVGAGGSQGRGPREVQRAAEALAAPAATGRGLFMVSALATTWGWFPDATGGKVVWAELGTGAVSGTDEGGASDERSSYAIRPVRLIAVPLRLLKASEDHLDDLFRELQMANLASSGRPPGSPPQPQPASTSQARAALGREAVEALAPTAEHVKARLARAREPLRRSIWEAARRGDRLIDINLLADAGAPAILQALEELLGQAAVAARRGYLLTEPPGAEVEAWRGWARQELGRQIGGKPPRACPFPVTAIVESPAGPAWRELDAVRRRELSDLRADLAAAAVGAPVSDIAPGFAEDPLTATALERVAELVGARRSVLSLLAEDNETVRFGASVGISADVVDYWQATSLSADLPASESIRTNRPVLFRTFAELDGQYPVFLSTPSESDPALVCMPLGGRDGVAFGALVIGFPQARDFSPSEVAFLEQLAQEVSTFLLDRRAQIEKRAALKRTAAVDRTSAVILACRTREDVLRELVDAVVAHLCDGAGVHIVEGQGSVRYFISRHRDPERLAAAATLLQKRQHQQDVPDNTDLIYECARTGKRSVVQLLSDEAISNSAQDEEDLVLLRRLALGAVGVMPVAARGRTVAVLSFANNVGRFISDADLSALADLAGTTGRALARLGF